MANRLEKLKDLEQRLLQAMDEADEKSLAPIAKQYRETIREIEELEGYGTEEDEIKNIIGFRADHGKPGAVRPDRSAL